MRIVDAAQRSPEWFAARAGKVTGSRAADVLAKVKSGKAAARRDYRLQLAVERITGTPMENGFVSADMQRGIDLEATAAARYEAATGHLLRHTGFLAHDTLAAGCSLDGDVDDFTGIVEIKCPKSMTHVGYLRAGVVPSGYLPQITHNLWISGAQWCDFVSLDDRLPAGLDWLCVRVVRDEAAIGAYVAEVEKFLAEVDAEYSALVALRG